MSVHNSINKGKKITVTIDGKTCQSTFGKTILDIARENGQTFSYKIIKFT